MKRREFIAGALGGLLAGGCLSRIARPSRDSGWIDLQVNGRVGVSFTDAELTEEKVLKVVEALNAGGTSHFLATIVTCPCGMAEHALRTIASARRKFAACERTILGVHMEGPFISPVSGYSGAHDRREICDPDPRVFDRWQDVSGGLVKMVTICGLRPGAEDFTRHVSGNGAVVSLGHTEIWATDDLNRLADAGAKTLTHLGNALPNELPRHKNIMWTGLANRHYMPMFIADGFHLPRETLHGYVRACPLERLVVVSDCTYPGGLPPGRYVHNGSVSVLEPSGFLRSPATNSLHGSSCLISDCIRVLNSPDVGLSMSDCRRLCHDNPLKLIGLS